MLSRSDSERKGTVDDDDDDEDVVVDDDVDRWTRHTLALIKAALHIPRRYVPSTPSVPTATSSIDAHARCANT